MADNYQYDGEIVSVVESALTHPYHADGLVDSGDLVAVGTLTGVAINSASAATSTIQVAVEGVWDLPATGATGSADSAIAVGDLLYMADSDVKATATLTSTGTAVADGATVTIGSVVYTFKTTLTTDPAAVPYEVLIGSTSNGAAALDNLKSAINGTSGAGSTYGEGTVAHPLVTATTNSNTEQVIEAITAGSAANAIATTETSNQLSWGDTTMLGGMSIGDLCKNSAKTHVGVALETVGAGSTATINVKLK
jgi:predicted RecA/RadA family phage recombinase